MKNLIEKEENKDNTYTYLTIFLISCAAVAIYFVFKIFNL